MALTKPSWLHNWLLSFNWEIFNIKLPIGDAMEYAVDYLIGWIDTAIVQSVAAYDKAVEAGMKAETAEQVLTSRITYEIDRVINLIAQAFPGITAIWEVLRPQVVSIIVANVQGVLDLTRQVQTRQDWLEYTLGVIQSNYAVRSWVEDRIEANRMTLEERLEAIQTDVWGLHQEQESLWDTIKRFFDDPLLFIIDALLQWIVNNLDRLFQAVEDALWGEA